MKVWKFHVPLDHRYAHLNNLWIKRPHTKCDSCGGHHYDPVQHLEVEWEDGSDVIPDFVFAIGPTVLRTDLAEQLHAKFCGFSIGEIRMPDHPNLRRPKTTTKRMPRRVWLPYDGPELCYLNCDPVDFLPNSTVVPDKSCDVCGKKTYKRPEGIETKNSRAHTQRMDGCGFFFRHADLGSRDIFKPRHMGFNLCTDRVRDFVLDRQWTNIEFLEVGNIHQ